MQRAGEELIKHSLCKRSLYTGASRTSRARKQKQLTGRKMVDNVQNSLGHFAHRTSSHALTTLWCTRKLSREG